MTLLRGTTKTTRVRLTTCHEHVVLVPFKLFERIPLNPFRHVVKWTNTLQKSCGVNTARFLKYVCPFYNIMHERVNESVMYSGSCQTYLMERFQK